MRYIAFLLFVSGCCLGCTGLVDDPNMRALKASLKTIDEAVVTARSEVVDALKENTTALAAIKGQIEALKVPAETPKVEEVIKSALEPQQVRTDANDSQPSTMIVAEQPAAVRLSAVKMKWDIEGNENPSILETARHLREDHGIIADGLSHQQMHDMHAAVHEGRRPVAAKSQPVLLINRGSQCPGGVCPRVIQLRQNVRRRR